MPAFEFEDSAKFWLELVVLRFPNFLFRFFLNFVFYPFIVALLGVIVLVNLFFRRPPRLLTTILTNFLLRFGEWFFNLVLLLLDNRRTRRLIRAAIQNVDQQPRWEWV